MLSLQIDHVICTGLLGAASFKLLCFNCAYNSFMFILDFSSDFVFNLCFIIVRCLEHPFSRRGLYKINKASEVSYTGVM